MESLPNETKMTNQVLYDCPSFSLGVEFEMSGKEKDVEVPLSKTEMAVHESDKIVEKSGKEFENSDKKVEGSNNALEINLNEEVEFLEDDWLRVDHGVAHSLAKHQEV